MKRTSLKMDQDKICPLKTENDEHLITKAKRTEKERRTPQRC